MIKYLGSKRLLIPWIKDTITKECSGVNSFLDLFSGTSRVGLAFKELGMDIKSNDHNLYAYYIAKCYIETFLLDLPQNFSKILEHLNSLPGRHGFFTQKYSIDAKFFHPNNGEKIDAIREELERLDINEKTKTTLLVSLMEAADRVDSTCGIQMAFLKSWAQRAHLPLTMKTPALIEKPKGNQDCKAYCLDAIEAAKQIECHVAYLDPPYNQHSYRGNYHIWETLIKFDNPQVYGKALKRIDCKTIKSDFNSKVKFKETLTAVLDNLKCKYIALSFSDEGFISKDELESLLSRYGSLKIFGMDYKRYIGAQIGIYSPKGVKVGQVKKLNNKEFLYIVAT